MYPRSATPEAGWARFDTLRRDTVVMRQSDLARLNQLYPADADAPRERAVRRGPLRSEGALLRVVNPPGVSRKNAGSSFVGAGGSEFPARVALRGIRFLDRRSLTRILQHLGW